jgi:hypothetical protein
MSNYYNLDDITTSLKTELARCTALAEAWRKVEFPTKKDGKPFANMSKNIKGAKYGPISYALQPGENELTVYTQTRETGYIHDTLHLYACVKNLKDPAMIAKTENYLPKQPYLEQVYRYDLDDIKKVVAEQADYWEKYAKDLEKQIDEAQRIFDSFRAAYAAAINGLSNDTAQFEHSDLFHAVKDCVLSRYPFV